VVENHGTPAGHIQAAEHPTAYQRRQDIPPADVENNPSESKAACVAYFGPDLDDPAVHRRVAQWRYAGFRILTFAFSRKHHKAAQAEDVVNLGYVAPQSRARRMIPLVTAGLRLIARRRKLRQCSAFIARNLDNAFIALFARWITGQPIPLVYEVLDINPSCTKAGLQGRVFRRLEKWMLSRAALLVVSSPHFVWAYYQGMLQFRTNWLLFENKVPKYARLPSPPAAPVEVPRSEGAAIGGRGARPRWRIGWFGYLDDNETWRILKRLARELPDRVFLHVRGLPYTNFDMRGFLDDVARMENAVYGGPFRNPEDLAEIYESIDIVWSADCNFLSANSKWLLTNGIYEAGYFGKPVIGLAGTAVGEFLEQYGSGWCLSDPVDQQLIALIDGLTLDRYDTKRAAIARMREDCFVECDELADIWQQLQSRRVQGPATAPVPPEVRSLS
jgi:succinoglycan biosynthesis protein ExoL